MEELRKRQLMALAENLRALANRHRDNGGFEVAGALYRRAVATVEKVRSGNGNPDTGNF